MSVLDQRDPQAVYGASLFGWWNADYNVTLSANKVTAWGALAGTGGSWSAGLAATRPTINTSAINGRRGITFDGAANVLTLAAATGALSQYTIGAMIKTPASGTTDSIVMSLQASNMQMMRINETAAGCLSMYDGTSQVRSGAFQVSTDRYYAIRYRFDGTNCKVYFNGSEVNSYIVGPTASAGLNIDALGNYANGSSNWFQGEIADLYIATTAGTLTQAQSVESFYQDWYGARSRARDWRAAR